MVSQRESRSYEYSDIIRLTRRYPASVRVIAELCRIFDTSNTAMERRIADLFGA